MGDKITQMFAFVVLDDGHGKGDEGIPAIDFNGMAMPMVGADMKRMESLWPIAQDLADKGMKIELRQFTSVDVIHEFEPTPKDK